ncbi:30S ribosomal protein S27e [Candidatus Bathyarchaeota archaeon]|jgi:small subunit ribosomal protein S27e|nr:30S ribosomal protein S27e [Candidatus Bathyarchaeota archaeon]MDP6048520.1 30S ribosomal protein S27e [Candidatus Bathyarchaeota archaeon]MDP7207009.1 30S ribosomal protein S27e [Candidatus Bathyarchaeota archaeon]
MSMKWETLIPRPSSRFLRVRCRTCESEQIIFSHTTHVINCRTCGEIMAEPTGGKAKIHSPILAVLG